MSYQATNGNGDNGSGGIGKALSGLATAVGVIAAILATPALFNATKGALYPYLSNAWGEGIAGVLMWVMAAAEAYAIYTAVSLVFTAAVLTFMAAWAAGRFRG